MHEDCTHKAYGKAAINPDSKAHEFDFLAQGLNNPECVVISGSAPRKGLILRAPFPLRVGGGGSGACLKDCDEFLKWTADRQ